MTHANDSGGAPANPPRHGGTTAAAIALVLVFAATLYLVRVTGAVDLADNDQLKPAAYTLDIVENASWVVQRDFTGAVASKPPLPVWISAAVSIATGSVHRVALTLPGFVGMAGLAVLAAWLGARRISTTAGLFAGVLVLASVTGEKLIALVRTDGLFALLVGITGFAILRCWERGGRGVFAVAVLAAPATLTKGPLALLLAGFGLLAIVWQRGDVRTPRRRDADVRDDRRLPILRASAAAALYIAIAGGWALAAYLAAGDAFVHKVFGDELVGKAVESGKGDPPLVNFFKSPSYFLGYYAPLSLLTIVGLVQCVRAPAAQPDERRLERFAFCWFVGGLAVFSIAPHQRPDLLAPLLLPAALLGGREVERIAAKRLHRTPGIAAASVIACLTIAASLVNRHVLVAAQTETAGELHLRAAAADFLEQPFADQPMLHTTDPHLFRYGIRRHRITVEPDIAAQELARSNASLIAVGHRTEPVASALEGAGLTREIVASYPFEPAPRFSIQIWRVDAAGND